METADRISTQQAEWLEHQGAGAGNARFLVDDKLIVSFTVEPWLNQRESNEQKRPVFEDREYIEIRIPGNSSGIVKRPVQNMDIARFRKKYDAWKETGENQQEGTPLAAWPKITVSQAKELEYYGIRTIENLANLNDSDLQNFRGARALKDMAKTYLDTVEGTRVKSLENEIAQLKQDMAAIATGTTPKPTRKPRASVSNRKPAD